MKQAIERQPLKDKLTALRLVLGLDTGEQSTYFKLRARGISDYKTQVIIFSSELRDIAKYLKQ